MKKSVLLVSMLSSGSVLFAASNYGLKDCQKDLTQITKELRSANDQKKVLFDQLMGCKKAQTKLQEDAQKANTQQLKDLADIKQKDEQLRNTTMRATEMQKELTDKNQALLDRISKEGTISNSQQVELVKYSNQMRDEYIKVTNELSEVIARNNKLQKQLYQLRSQQQKGSTWSWWSWFSKKKQATE